MTQNSEILRILQVQNGMVCLVGAGGKKTTLYTLARLFPGRIGITTTVHLPPFPSDLEGVKIIAPAEQLHSQVVEAAERHRVVAFAHPSQTDYRVTGVSSEALVKIQRETHFDLLLVKADGARQRLIKAPAPYEPVIPPGANTVLALVSARTLGRPLDDGIAHRVELIEAITGAQRGALLQPIHMARLLASEHGLMRKVGKARVVPLINQVDTPQLQASATEAARQALSLNDRFEYVVLAAMRRENPIVDVIVR